MSHTHDEERTPLNYVAKRCPRWQATYDDRLMMGIELVPLYPDDDADYVDLLAEAFEQTGSQSKVTCPPTLFEGMIYSVSSSIDEYGGRVLEVSPLSH